MTDARKRESWNPLLKSYPESEKINAISIGAETMYTRLIAKADDYGNYYGDPALILAYLFGHRFAAGTVSVTDTARWRDELVTCPVGPLAAPYSVNGVEYLHLINLRRRFRNDVTPDERFPREPANLEEKVLSEHVTKALRQRTEHVTKTARRRNEHGPLDSDTDTDTDTDQSKKTSARKSPSTAINKSSMARITEKYKALKGVSPQGNEWLPIQKTIKLMLNDGRTEEQIVACIEDIAEAAKNGCDWLQNWTINTVRLKIAEHIAGTLVLSQQHHQKHHQESIEPELRILREEAAKRKVIDVG